VSCIVIPVESCIVISNHKTSSFKMVCSRLEILDWLEHTLLLSEHSHRRSSSLFPSSHSPLTHGQTVTLWYRAPEIILGTRYSPAIDLWSVGCIFWEMIEKDPLFCGDSAIGELYLIFESALLVPPSLPSLILTYCLSQAAWNSV
jgi:serine/threonine protein kinase